MLYKDKIWVFDDIIPFKQQQEIKHTMLDVQFPWFYVGDVTDGHDNSEDKEKRPGFIHLFSDHRGQNSDFFPMITQIAANGCKKVEFDFKTIVKSRSFLQLPLGLKDESVDDAHIDYPEQHLVVLYYVIDSDGDTIIYDKQFKPGDPLSWPARRMGVPKKRVTPKQGRVVVFDGRYFHTAQQPKNDTRCIINFNLE